MQNELMTVSDIELAKMENDIKVRASSLETKTGITESREWILAMFEYLKNSGYKIPSDDVKGMAKAYAGQLKDAIIIYGYDNISLCVKEWVKRDTYGRFPNAGQILKVVHELCGNPLAEVARRNHEAEVQRMVQREQKELRSKYSEDELKELERRYSR